MSAAKKVVKYPDSPVPSPIDLKWLLEVRDGMKDRIAVTCRDRDRSIDCVTDRNGNPSGCTFFVVLRH